MPTFMMPAKKGNCQVCAIKHLPWDPHDAQSLPYQMWFQSTHGRGATWADAMAHCTDKVKDAWKKILVKKNVWTEPKDGSKPIATVDENKGEPKLRPMPNMEPVEYKIKN